MPRGGASWRRRYVQATKAEGGATFAASNGANRSWLRRTWRNPDNTCVYSGDGASNETAGKRTFERMFAAQQNRRSDGEGVKSLTQTRLPSSRPRKIFANEIGSVNGTNYGTGSRYRCKQMEGGADLLPLLIRIASNPTGALIYR